jgi:hypothetical protein
MPTSRALPPGFWAHEPLIIQGFFFALNLGSALLALQHFVEPDFDQ